ncbi:hypothetical protein ACU4HD_43505 [Cupriavidus basilensis]
MILSTWTLEDEDAKGNIVVRTQGNKLLTLNLAPAEESGDQTVPAKASAEAVGGTLPAIWLRPSEQLQR